MRYRKENGQWKKVTPLGVSREEFDELKQDLTHKIEDVEDKFSWKFLSTTAVGSSVVLPSDFNEAKVIIKNNTNKDCFIFDIPKNELDTVPNIYVGGGSWQANNITYVSAQLNAGRTITGLYRLNGVNVTDNITKTIYYR